MISRAEHASEDVSFVPSSATSVAVWSWSCSWFYRAQGRDNINKLVFLEPLEIYGWRNAKL